MPTTLTLGAAQMRRRNERRSLARMLAWSDTFAALALGVCLATFVAFATGFTPVLRPLYGQTIHPVTALGGTLLALATLLAYRRDRAGVALRRLFCWSVLAAMLARLLLEPLTTSLFDRLIPPGLLRPGIPEPAVSENSAICLGLLATALLLRRLRDALYSQTLVFIAYGFPTLSLIGYLMGIGRFHGQMSLTTVLILVPLCASVLLSTVRHGFLRRLLGNTRISGLARNYLLLIMMLPYLIGFLLMRGSSAAAGLPIAMLTVATSQLIGLCICFFVLSGANIEVAGQAAMRQALSAAQLDPLTGAINRRHFLECADPLLQRSRVDGSTLSLAFIDIDHFKRVNDTHGHAAGDVALKGSFALARAGLRREDLISRWGGEEFVVLLPGADLESAGHIAEGLRRQIADATIRHARGELRLTVSIGCVQFDGTETLAQMIDRADAALYRAKSLGRDRVVVG